jgi:hypothetical protein
MDTRFWGPSGWKMLHLITFDYKYSPTSVITYSQFFDSIPYILPCKFCRASLTDYYRQYPFKISKCNQDSIDPKLDLKKWMYNIHNCVNDKLRKQGLNPNLNPKFSDVKVFYDKWLKCDWHKQLTTFWDFLFAVAYNHPKESSLHSKPMPDCPKEVYKCKDKCEKNKWNVLSLNDRIYWFRRFWSFLPAVLPGEIAYFWKEVERKNPPKLECRRSALAWLWRMRCALDTNFKDPYTSVCQKIASYSSDCGKKKRAITCRKHSSFKKHKSLRKTLKNTK